MKKITHYFSVLIVIAGIFFHSLNANSQSLASSEYQIKAAFLYKFCFYIEWPKNTFSNANSPLIIGVAASDNVIGKINEAVKNRKIQGRSITVIPVHGAEEIHNLHMLFIARSEEHRSPVFMEKVKGQKILVVTESLAGMEDDSVINFVAAENRIRFDVDLTVASKYGLQISAQLLKVARTVHGGA